MSTILLVDDTPRLMRLAEEAIRPLGHEILTASSGPKALDIMASNQIDLVVAEYRMTEMDGMQFLCKIRAEKYKTPVVFAANFIPENVRQAAALFGVKDYLDRNYPRKQTQDTINRILEMQAQICEGGE